MDTDLRKPETIFDSTDDNGNFIGDKILHSVAMKYLNVIQVIKDEKGALTPANICKRILVTDPETETSRPITEQEYWEVRDYIESGAMDDTVQISINEDIDRGGEFLEDKYQ